MLHKATTVLTLVSLAVGFSSAMNIPAGADSPDQLDGLLDDVVDVTDSMSLLAPEKGDEVPDFPVTFPGCSCEWAEGWTGGWSCENDILAPESMAGKTCCCCTTSCIADHRCTNEECLLLGVDQAAGVAKAAAEKAARDAEKAIPDIGGAEITTVRLPPGYCTFHTILAACKKIGQVPLCNSYGVYASMDRGKPGCRRWRNTNYCKNADNCWFPFMGGQGGPNEAKAAPFKKWQWVVWSSVAEVEKVGLNPLKFGGSCFYAMNGGTTQAIYAPGPGTGMGAQWTPNQAAHNVWPWKNMDGEGTAADLYKDGYPTWCVDQKPLPYAKNGQ